MKDLRWQLKIFREEFKEWFVEISQFLRQKILNFASGFEKTKDVLVDVLMAKRGVHQRSFLHIGMIVLISGGLIIAPLIAEDYPILGNVRNISAEETPSSVLNIQTSVSEQETTTQESEKPRDKTVTHIVKGGETLSSIAQDYKVSLDTIKWANPDKITSDKSILRPGDELAIPPLTGVVHKVKSGDSIYSIAEKYGVSAQNIVNFPFNTYADDETFALAIGTELVVPEGVMPQQKPVRAIPLPVTLVAGGSGQYIWPASGSITQYPVWYHMAVDIANPSAPAVIAADTGVVVLRECLNWGYGCYMIIDHGNGFQTLYGHMQAFYVSLGDKVNRGQAIGQMGSTGRSTGTHLHFEVRKGGVTQNPLNYLR